MSPSGDGWFGRPILRPAKEPPLPQIQHPAGHPLDADSGISSTSTACSVTSAGTKRSGTISFLEPKSSTSPDRCSTRFASATNSSAAPFPSPCVSRRRPARRPHRFDGSWIVSGNARSSPMGGRCRPGLRDSRASYSTSAPIGSACPPGFSPCTCREKLSRGASCACRYSRGSRPSAGRSAPPRSRES